MSKAMKSGGKKQSAGGAGETEMAAAAPIDAREAAALSSEETQRLMRIGRFLVKVADAEHSRIRVKVAYSSADHAEGWRLFRAAAGEGELLNVPVAPAPPSTTPGIIALLDDFENKWFPRTRRIIERFVPADHRDAFSAAFFLDLKQQPLGPLVVSSVSTFLDRVEGLAKSKVPGAAAVRAELTRRGVDGDTIKRLRSAIEHARTLSPAAPAPAVDPSLALRARRAAYESLRLWWRDWRETFASEVDGRARRELGLVDTSLDPKAPPVEP